MTLALHGKSNGRRAILVGAALFGVLVAIVMGAGFQQGRAIGISGIDGLWANASGSGGGQASIRCAVLNNTASTTDENSFYYGDDTNGAPCPASNAVQSGFGFTGAAASNPNSGDTFLVGKFVHYNRPVFFGEPIRNKARAQHNSPP